MRETLNYRNTLYIFAVNCQQAFEAGDVTSGEKLLYTSSGASFTAWCWYSATTDEGLLYLSKDAVTDVSLDFSQLNMDSNRVALTFFTELDNSGETYRGDIRRLDGEDATVLQNTATGFKVPRDARDNPDHGYLFLGILTLAEANVKSTQGFQLSGSNCVFNNCDTNPNSYFAFFTEARGRLTNLDLPNCMINNLQQDSDNSAMSSRYKFSYAAQFGGCGDYLTPPNLNGYKCGNIGLWFSYGKN